MRGLCSEQVSRSRQQDTSTTYSSKSSPARLVTALESASAEGTPFPDPDMSSPSSSLANFSFIRSISARNATA